MPEFLEFFSLSFSSHLMLIRSEDLGFFFTVSSEEDKEGLASVRRPGATRDEIGLSIWIIILRQVL